MTGQCEKSSLGRSGINREIRYETTWDTTAGVAGALARFLAHTSLLAFEALGAYRMPSQNRIEPRRPAPATSSTPHARPGSPSRVGRPPRHRAGLPSKPDCGFLSVSRSSRSRRFSGRSRRSSSSSLLCGSPPTHVGDWAMCHLRIHLSVDGNHPACTASLFAIPHRGLFGVFRGIP